MADQTRNDSLTVGTSNVLVSQNKGAGVRTSVLLRNNSTGGQTITLNFSDFEAAVSGYGVVLAVGQSLTDASSEGYICWQGNINAIASGAGAVLSVYERVKG
jgi:hypothetical protein